jgi:hypothetical protein
MLQTVTKWVLFGVIVSSIPIIFGIFNAFILKNIPWNLELIIGNGEVFIVTAALCAGGLGELIGSGGKLQTPKFLSGGACVIILLISTLSFSGVAEGATSDGVPYDKAAVVTSSLWIYLSGIISTGVSIILAEA